MLDDARAALLAVLERAHNDQDESVRVQAVTAVAAWPSRHEVEGDLRAIAGGDPAQAVRYEAERALFDPEPDGVGQNHSRRSPDEFSGSGPEQEINSQAGKQHIRRPSCQK